jgi:hypothetical protein
MSNVNNKNTIDMKEMEPRVQSAEVTIIETLNSVQKNGT